MTVMTQGLHHVTAIAGAPQRNIDFYITGLGLRLVKKTVNFDDPGTYHLYYGDEAGRPGSLITFFPWRGIQQGRVGADPEQTIALLTNDLGLTIVDESASRTRLAAGDGSAGTIVDVIGSSLAPDGLGAGGTVHHIAFRVPDHATQAAWREELVGKGHQVTGILDRQYFTSIYFREPGGVLFEIATDTPGFDIDEPLLELGRSLKLPPWLEPSREQIEHSVAQITLPEENNPALGAA